MAPDPHKNIMCSPLRTRTLAHTYTQQFQQCECYCDWCDDEDDNDDGSFDGGLVGILWQQRCFYLYQLWWWWDDGDDGKNDDVITDVNDDDNDFCLNFAAMADFANFSVGWNTASLEFFLSTRTTNYYYSSYYYYSQKKRKWYE